MKGLSHSFLLFAGSVLVLAWLFFLLADYSWEKKKCRGLNAQVQSGKFGMRSERTEYECYSWVRYLAIILLTYVNTIGVIDSEPQDSDGLVSPVHMLSAFSVVILFSIGLLAIDGYWDRKRQHRLSGICATVFWPYFWLRYPALILATIVATRRGLQP